jgi:hypothetical protein
MNTHEDGIYVQHARTDFMWSLEIRASIDLGVYVDIC